MLVCGLMLQSCLKAYATGLRAVFPHVDIFGRGTEFQPFDRNTYVLMASRQPLNRQAFQGDHLGGQRRHPNNAARGREAERLFEIRPRADADGRLRAGGSVAGEVVYRTGLASSLGIHSLHMLTTHGGTVTQRYVGLLSLCLSASVSRGHVYSVNVVTSKLSVSDQWRTNTTRS